MNLQLVESEGATRIRLRVKAGARRTAILGEHDGALKLSVTPAPEKGKANKAVLSVLGEALGVAPSSLAIVAGLASPDKTVVAPLPPEAIRRRLGAVVEAG